MNICTDARIHVLFTPSWAVWVLRAVAYPAAARSRGDWTASQELASWASLLWCP